MSLWKVFFQNSALSVGQVALLVQFIEALFQRFNDRVWSIRRKQSNATAFRRYFELFDLPFSHKLIKAVRDAADRTVNCLPQRAITEINNTIGIAMLLEVFEYLFFNRLCMLVRCVGMETKRHVSTPS